MTTGLGLGACGFGVAPYGIGTPAATAPLGGDALTAPDGVRYGSRKIDLATRRYVYDSRGRLEGDDPIRQEMQLVATTDLGSSAVLALGNTMRSVKDVTPNVVQRIRAIYTNAYARMVARGVIRLGTITVEIIPATPTRGAKALTRIPYTNLATGKDDEITL